MIDPSDAIAPRAFLYFARCDNALAAADFCAGVEKGERITAEAFDAAARLVASVAVRYWVSALAAAER